MFATRFHMYAITGCLHITENMLLLIECVFLQIFQGTFFMFNMNFESALF